MHDFESYIQLLDKVDDFAVSTDRKFESDITCKAGCNKCCVSGITLWSVEYDRIAKELYNTSIKKTPSTEGKCTLLNDKGECSIYDIRPLVCRLWGLPLLISTEDLSSVLDGKDNLSKQISSEKTLICCDLNFQNKLDSLAKGDMLNADLVLTMLAAINHVYCKAMDTDPTERFPLR